MTTAYVSPQTWSSFCLQRNSVAGFFTSDLSLSLEPSFLKATTHPLERAIQAKTFTLCFASRHFRAYQRDSKLRKHKFPDQPRKSCHTLCCCPRKFLHPQSRGVCAAAAPVPAGDSWKEVLDPASGKVCPESDFNPLARI
jgi:hypothetical protein